MSFPLSCRCIYYALKFLKTLSVRNSVNDYIFCFLKKNRNKNWLLASKNKFNPKIRDFLFYQNLRYNLQNKTNFKPGNMSNFSSEKKKLIYKKKRFSFQRGSVKKLQHIKNIFFPDFIPSFQDLFPYRCIKKLLTVIKPLFKKNCIRLKSVLINICYVFSKKINAVKLLTLVKWFSCEKDNFFKQYFLDILFFVHKNDFFLFSLPVIRKLSWKKLTLFPINLLFFNITLIRKKSLYLYSFEQNILSSTIKRFLLNKNPRFFILSLIILIKLFYLNRLQHSLKTNELIFIIFNRFKKKHHSTVNYFLKIVTLLFKNLSFLNIPDLFLDFFAFIENSLVFKKFPKKTRGLIFITNLLPERTVMKRKILNLFGYCKTKIWISFKKNSIQYWGKITSIFFINLVNITRKTRFENFIKFEFFEKSFKKDMSKMEILGLFFTRNFTDILFDSQKKILEIFKCIFLTINRYSVKIRQGKTLIKRIFQVLQELLIKMGSKSKLFLPQVSGLIKWGLFNKNPYVQKYTSKFVTNFIPIFFYFKEKILVGYLGTILVDEIDNKSTRIKKFFLKSLCQIVKVFPANYCIPPIEEIFASIYPLIKNIKIRLKSDLINLLSLIMNRKILFIPKKDLILLCSVLVNMQKNHNIKNRKVSLKIINQISKIYGPNEIVDFLIDLLEKSKGIFRLSIIITLATLAYNQNLQLILPKLYQQYLTTKFQPVPNIIKSLIYILEHVESFKLLNYGNSLGIILEIEMFIRKSSNNPLLFLLIGKFIEKLQFSGLETKLVLVFKFLIINFFKSSGLILRYLFFAFEKLLSTLNPIIWWKPLFQGLIHRKRKIRILYKKFQKLIDIKQNIWFFFLKFLKNSKRNILSDYNFFI
jgi:hypothetical protein